MRENHMTGLTFFQQDPDWEKIRALGVKWTRCGVPYPWKDKVNGTYSERFLASIERLKKLKSLGYEIMVYTNSMGSLGYDKEAGDEIWHPGFPAWMGGMDDDGFYEALDAGMREIAKIAGQYTKWYQLGNEPDFKNFIGPVTREQNVRFNETMIKAMVSADPEMKCGINLAGIAGSEITEYARWLTKTLYVDKDLPYAWLGLDAYFGCWQPGGPEDWGPYIDTMAALSKKPILISEWGYATLYGAPFEKDFERKEHYNNINCKEKHWENMWKGQKHSPELQADYIRQCLKIFADHPAVIGNFFFRWDDCEICGWCGEHDCPTETHWGIVDVNEDPKPGYYALKEAIGELFS